MLHVPSSGALTASAVGSLKPEVGASVPKAVFGMVPKPGAAGVKPNAEVGVGDAEVGVGGRKSELGGPLPNSLPVSGASNIVPNPPLGPPVQARWAIAESTAWRRSNKCSAESTTWTTVSKPLGAGALDALKASVGWVFVGVVAVCA